MRIESESRGPETTLPLIMLPGTLCSARVFDPVRQRLSFIGTEVMLTSTAGSLEEAAVRVLAQAPERFLLLGFSLGGMVAMEAALRAPERVRALVLVSTTPLPVPAERHAARRASVEMARGLPMRQFVRERLWPDYGGAPGDAGTLPLLEQMAEELGVDIFDLQTEMALRRSDFCPRLPALRLPTLIIAGSEDALCPPHTQQRLAEALPNSTTVMLPNAGHFALLQQPDEVAEVVAAWLHTNMAAEHAELADSAGSDRGPQ